MGRDKTMGRGKWVFARLSLILILMLVACVIAIMPHDLDFRITGFAIFGGGDPADGPKDISGVLIPEVDQTGDTIGQTDAIDAIDNGGADTEEAIDGMNLDDTAADGASRDEGWMNPLQRAVNELLGRILGSIEGRSDNEEDGQGHFNRTRFSWRLREGIELWANGSKLDDSFTGIGRKERLSIRKRGILISLFIAELRGTEDLSMVVADYDRIMGKSFFHAPRGLFESVDLYVPKIEGAVRVRVCENASGFDEVFEGCGRLPSIGREYVLAIGDAGLSVSEEGLFFLVHIVSGTGGQGESDWWNDSFVSRMTINITAGSDTIPAGYTMNISLNTTGLVGQGLMEQDGSDLRVVYWNGSNNMELDRINESRWGIDNTVLSFRIVDDITDSSVGYVLYYGNPNSGRAPENKSKVYYLWEDLEDQSSEFTNGPLAPVINSSSKKNGNYGLVGDGGGGYGRAVKPDVLGRGMRIEGWVYSGYEGDNADLPGLAFGMQPTGDQKNGYQVVLDWRSTTGSSGDMQIRLNYNSNSVLNWSAESMVTDDTWYYMRVTWKSSGQIDAMIFDSAMNRHGHLIASDTTYSSGYYGIGAYRDGFWDDVKVTLHIDDGPEYEIGEREANGPIIMGAGAYPPIVMRSEYVTISANITSENGVSEGWAVVTYPNSTPVLAQMDNESEAYLVSFMAADPGTYSAVIYANDTNGTLSSYVGVSWTTHGWSKVAGTVVLPAEVYQGDVSFLSCLVTDANTSRAIASYPVAFSSNVSGAFARNMTNVTGWARAGYLADSVGDIGLSCSIQDNSTLFYNTSFEDSITDALVSLQPPVLTILSAEISASDVGSGENVTITALVTSPNEIDEVMANVTGPGGSFSNITLAPSIGDYYSGTFSDAWMIGAYQIRAWANDSIGDIDVYGQTFNVDVLCDLSVSVGTDADAYGTSDSVLLASGAQNWWDPNYGYRRRMPVINTGSGILREGHTANITIDSSALAGEEKMRGDCNDLRVVWIDGSQNRELDRIVSGCGSSSTTVMFAIQENISAYSTENDYYLYYGKPTAAELIVNKSKVYIFFEDFENYTVGEGPGSAWADDTEVLTNNWRIVSDSGDKAVQDTAIDGAYHRIWAGSDQWADYEVSAAVKLDAFRFTGITFRRQPKASTYYNHYALITDDRVATNKMALRRWTGGGSNFAAIASDNTDFDDALWHNYTIRARGTSIQMFRDGVRYINYDISGDSPSYQTGGSVGLMSHEGLSMFDDVSVRLVASSEPGVTLGAEEPRITDSSITNGGSRKQFGYVSAIVETWDGDGWASIGVVVNQSDAGQMNMIEGGSSLGLTDIWDAAGGFGTDEMENGTYRVAVAFTDPAGNTLNLTGGGLAMASAVFSIDAIPPAIGSMQPGNGIGIDGRGKAFSAVPVDENAVDSCQLIVNGQVRDSESSVESGIGVMLSLGSLDAGNYLWWIECEDEHGNVGYSDIRQFAVIKNSQFDGATTNISNLNVSAIEGLVIERAGYGMINFTETVDLSGGVDIDSHVTISYNSISVQSSLASALNRSAILTLSGVALQRPVILQDGSVCEECNIIESGMDVVFEVLHFTEYSAAENAQLSVYDTTDSGRVFLGMPVEIIANYSNRTDGDAIAGAEVSCEIAIEDGPVSLMAFNETTGLYEITNSFSDAGIFLYNISCNDTSGSFAGINLEGYASINSDVGPVAVSNVSVGSSERASFEDEAVIIAAQGGNASKMSISARQVTSTWQGYVGTIQGIVVLSDGEGDVIYDWNLTTPSGEIYATRSQDVNFIDINCSDPGQISDEESYLGQSDETGDSVSNTFNDRYHPEFSIGALEIPENSCSSANLFVNGSSQNETFFEVMMSDSASHTVYVSLIDHGAIGFDGGGYDFQMIVGDNGYDEIDSTPYYFFVELA